MGNGAGWWYCWYSIVLILSHCILNALSSDPGDDGRPQGSPISDDGQYFQFVTRPDIQAPVWDIVRKNESLVAPGYWFIAPYEEKTQEEPGGAFIGPHIYDGNGELIWSGTPFFGHWNVFDFTVSNVDGEPHLTMQDWHGQRGVILDSSYDVWKTAPMLAAGDSFQNMHAFHVVDDGKRALALDVRQWDTSNERSIAELGYDGTCQVSFQGFRELDLQASGTPIVFEWEPRDHISLNESTYVMLNPRLGYDGSVATMCQLGGWDAMHVNAIDKFPDGDYLLSARHSDTLYKISHVDGSVVWRLGGKTSDFESVGDAQFARQHHGEVLEQNSTHCIISLFDNAIGEGFQKPLRGFSRGLILSLDLQRMTATVLAQYGHPQGRLSNGRGNMQVLPNGNAFLNWAVNSQISEHTPDGAARALDASLPAHLDTYRAFKFPWIGRPTQPPDVHAEVVWDDDHRMTTKVSMSWNGATEVHRWAVYGIDAGGNPARVATVPRAGFETTVRLAGLVTNGYAEALDRNGTVLGTSKDGGQAWPERIQGWSKGRPDDVSTSTVRSTIITAFGVVGTVVNLGLAGFLLHRLSRRRADVREAKGKGEYIRLGQDEEATDD